MTIANPAAGATNGSVVYTATLTVPGSACFGASSTTVMMGNTPATAPTTTSANRCGTGTVNLTATYTSAGYINWYASASGGTVLDQDTLIIGGLTSSFTTPVLGISTAYYASFFNGVCESARTLAAAGVTPSTAVSLTVTGATTYCSVPGSAGITLNAFTSSPAMPTPYDFTWLPATGLFTNPGLTTAYTVGTQLATVYAAPGDTITYIATGSNAVCADTESVKITVHPSPYTPFVSSTNTTCSADTVIMNLAGGGLMPSGYCTSTATSAIDDDIANINITQGATVLLNNNSVGWPGAATVNPGSNRLYTDYTATVPPVVLAPGSTYSVRATQYNSGGSYTCYTRVFFDWNRDGDFLDAGEAFNAGNTTAGTFATATVLVPNTASIGLTRMRVVLVEGGTNALAPCGTYTWGETEDYSVIINQPISYAWTATLAGGATSNGLPPGAGTPSTANVGVLALPTALGSNGTITYILTMTNTQTGCSDTTVKPITVIPLPPTPTAPGVSRCGYGTINLVATNTASGNFDWYGQAVGGISLLTTTAAMTSTFTTPALAVTDTFWVEFNNGPCPTNRVMVIATVTAAQQVVMTPNTTPVICDGGSVSLTASTAATPVGGAYSYSWSPSTGLSASNLATVTCTSNDTIDYVVTGSNGTCSDTANIRVRVNPLPTTTPTATPSTICTGGNVALSIPTTPAPVGYCANGATSTIDDDIANVKLMQGATVLLDNNSTGWPGAITSNAGSANTYTNYTALPAVNILPSTSYTISVIQYNSGVTFYGCYVHVFFDWNRDGDFADVGEDIPVGGTAFGATTTAAATVTLTFTTPNFASSGITRMRVKQVEGGTNALTNSCVAYTWGETEDYTVNLLPYTYAWSGALSGGATANGLNPGSQIASALNTSTTAVPTTGLTQGTVTYGLATASTVTGCSGTATVAVTVQPAAVANAGNGQTLCYGSVATLGATSTGGANAGTWTGGLGSFGSASVGNTGYTPALAESGSTLTLTWTTNATGLCAAASDTVNLTINTPATSNAGADGAICVADVRILSAVSTPGTGLWSTPNGFGTFGSASSANTIYTPNASDVAVSPILLIWTTSAPSAPCTAKADTLLLTVNNTPSAPTPVTANASVICEGETSNLNATAAGSTISWFTVASGGSNIGTSASAANFAVTPASTTTYYAEAATGTCLSTMRTAVVVTVNTVPVAPTPVTATAATICVGSSANLNGNSTGNTIQWFTAASGGTNLGMSASGTNFAVSPALTTTYYAEALTASTCISATRTPVTVTVDPVAVANAGNGQTVCYGTALTLGASSSGGANAGTWTGGAGSYSTNSNPAATYTPNLSESGSTLTLTWTTNATGACPVAADTVHLSINAPATVNAGADISTCGLGTLTLTGAMGGSASATTWSGTYAGSFSSLSNPSGTYTPNSSEIGSTLTLTLTTNDPDGSGPCAAAADNVDITVGGYTTTLAPPVISSTPWVADYENTDVFNWTHYYDNAGTPTNYCDDYLILSIQNANLGGNAIGHVGDPGFSVKVAGIGAYSLTNASTPYVSMGVNWYLMGRYWEATPVTQPVNDLNVKFYFTTADFNAVNAVSPYVSSSPTQMAFYKINNGVGGTPTYNPDPAVLHSGVPVASPFAYNGTGYWQYLNSGTASTSTWAYSTFGTDHVAEYTVERFSGGGGGGGTGNAGAFPVELLSFTGYNSGNENILEWTTTKEMNNQSFVLMHSLDNIAFEEIATVPTQAPNGISNTPLSYTSKDLDFADKTYYRLKQIDIDGTSRIYPTSIEVQVNNDLNTVVSLFPNPAKDVLNISITQPQGGKHKVEIYDAIGKLVSVHKADLKGGNTVLTLDVAELAKGTYIIMVKNADNGTVANTRFVKE